MTLGLSFSGSIGALVLSAGCAGIGAQHPSSGANLHTHHATEAHKVDASIARASTALYASDDALFSYVKRYGLARTISRLNELERSGRGDCHQPAHKAGRFAYELYGVPTFAIAPLECHVGGLHGAIEAYFRERGTDDLPEEGRQICGIGRDAFFESQCFHGIGHGLMAASDYELPEALKGCDLLETGKEECYTGAFMENIVGGLGGHHHGGTAHSKYMSSDPQFPCSIVGDRYKPSCYLLQTSRMIQLFGPNFARIAAACTDAPSDLSEFCFQSMGRDVGGLHRGDAAGAIRACESAPAGGPRVACLSGAVQDLFWDASGTNVAVQFCRALTDAAEKRACYETIVGRATVTLTTEARRDFCATIEAPFQRQCAAAGRD
jgi:hypothetical protein